MSNQHEGVWEQGWDDHQRQQRERLSALPLSARLQWLEDAHHLAQRLSSTAQTPSRRVTPPEAPPR